MLPHVAGSVYGNSPSAYLDGTVELLNGEGLAGMLVCSMMPVVLFGVLHTANNA